MIMNWVTIHIECLKLDVKIDIAIMKRSPTVNVPIEPHPGKTHKGSKGKRHGGGHDHQTVFLSLLFGGLVWLARAIHICY